MKTPRGVQISWVMQIFLTLLRNIPSLSAISIHFNLVLKTIPVYLVLQSTKAASHQEYMIDSAGTTNCRAAYVQ